MLEPFSDEHMDVRIFLDGFWTSKFCLDVQNVLDVQKCFGESKMFLDVLVLGEDGAFPSSMTGVAAAANFPWMSAATAFRGSRTSK